MLLLLNFEVTDLLEILVKKHMSERCLRAVSKSPKIAVFLLSPNVQLYFGATFVTLAPADPKFSLAEHVEETSFFTRFDFKRYVCGEKVCVVLDKSTFLQKI